MIDIIKNNNNIIALLEGTYLSKYLRNNHPSKRIPLIIIFCHIQYGLFRQRTFREKLPQNTVNIIKQNIGTSFSLSILRPIAKTSTEIIDANNNTGQNHIAPINGSVENNFNTKFSPPHEHLRQT